jgi:hypothetical protein
MSALPSMKYLADKITSFFIPLPFLQNVKKAPYLKNPQLQKTSMVDAVTNVFIYLLSL